MEIFELDRAALPKTTFQGAFFVATADVSEGDHSLLTQDTAETALMLLDAEDRGLIKSIHP